MTRINVVPVEELSDQHLIAEYRELPRCIKQKIDVKNAPTTYCLGTGHMKWARAHIKFLLRRYRQLCIEMAYRGFTVNFGWDNLVYIACLYSPAGCLNTDYAPTRKDIKLNKERLIEKYCKKPTFYKWTHRNKPKYMEVRMKQITIYELLPLLKKGWVAMDEDGRWSFYNYKPKKGNFGNYWCESQPYSYSLNLFNIAPFDGDWKDSLIKVEHKEEE